MEIAVIILSIVVLVLIFAMINTRIDIHFLQKEINILIEYIQDKRT